MILILVVQVNQKLIILKSYHVASRCTGGRHDYKRDYFRCGRHIFIVH